MKILKLLKYIFLFKRRLRLERRCSLGKKKNLPSPTPLEKKNDDMDMLDGPSILESETYIVDDPMEPLDPPPCDNPIRKRPFLLHVKL